MRNGFKTFVSFAIGVFLATVCTEQATASTPVPIRCLNGRITYAGTGFQRCECYPGFIGPACQWAYRPTRPPIRCVNGVITSAGTSYQRCECNPGFMGPACDLDRNWLFPTTPPPIRCVNGVITSAGTSYQRCECNPGFMGPACDLDRNWLFPTTPPPIRCVNGVITSAGTSYQRCECNPGFMGSACDLDRNWLLPTTRSPTRCVNGYISSDWSGIFQHCECYPGFTGRTCEWASPLEQTTRGQQESLSSSTRNDVFLIVGVPVGALIVGAGILAVVFVCKRRQRLNNQVIAANARRQPRNLRTGGSHGIYAIPCDLDVKLPPYTPPTLPPPYDHLDNNRAGLVVGKDYLSPPPSYCTNLGYQTMSSVQTVSVGDNVCVGQIQLSQIQKGGRVARSAITVTLSAHMKRTIVFDIVVLTFFSLYL
ncbi:delta-like protein A isoform X1 [Dreissena polymorpha]|uniref:EGF-like domain-containing protein n=1 Tax=Dreissena polymorpha TaxID=45954 RepID=A0A9D4HNV4_DREPO|nr:delta-like protein A isoform X1 [Dreissena polymorpha]KAH3727527.1 hypothetical protein DPMN_053466 [Dreissena polymorpha]